MPYVSVLPLKHEASDVVLQKRIEALAEIVAEVFTEQLQETLTARDIEVRYIDPPRLSSGACDYRIVVEAFYSTQRLRLKSVLLLCLAEMIRKGGLFPQETSIEVTLQLTWGGFLTS